jgi:hypothetical protein
MTIQSTLKKASATKLALANSLLSSVRELEKDASGVYIAFVDHEEHSYDVAVETNEKLQVKKFSCDCGDVNMPCAHILAVLLSLESKKFTTDKAVIKLKKEKPKKLTPTQLLVENLSKEDVLLWLYAELDRDKRLFNNFKNHFENKDKTATAEYINLACSESITAVINRRKTVQLPELTLILDSWQQIFDQALTSIAKNIYSKKSIDVILAIYENLAELYDKIAKNTTKIETFRDKIIQKFSLQVSLLPDDLKREFFYNFFLKIKNFSHDLYRFFIGFAIFTIDSNSKEIAHHVIDKISFLHNFDIDHFNKKMKIKFIEWLKEVDQLSVVAEKLYGVTYENEYNIYLIDALLDIQKFEHAIFICFECINQNYYEEYNEPYYAKIEEIIEKANDSEFELFVKRKFLSIRINYEDFIYFLDQIKNESDKQGFIEGYLENCKIKTEKNKPEIFKVKMKVLLLQGRPDLVFNKIDTWDSIMDCKPFWDELYIINKDLLIKKITAGINRYYYQYNPKKLEEGNELKKWMLENYNADQISKLLNTEHKRVFLST